MLLNKSVSKKGSCFIVETNRTKKIKYQVKIYEAKTKCCQKISKTLFEFILSRETGHFVGA